MYIDKDGQQVWENESTTYEIKNELGEVVRTFPAIKFEHYTEVDFGDYKGIPEELRTEVWILNNQTKSEAQINEERKQELQQELDNSDKKLIRLIEDLVTHAKQTGFVVPTEKQLLIEERIAKRLEVKGL